MVSAEDVLIVFNAKDNVTATTKKLSSSMNGLRLGVGVALSAASAYMVSFAKDAMSAAGDSQKEWARFGGAVDSTGGNWAAQSSSIKSWVSSFSNSMGMATGDTRNAATALMNYGMSWKETQNSMGAVAGLAAKTGSTEEASSKMIISALNGRGTALSKATGLQIENYKAADGSIDRARLLRDITNSTKPSLDAFKNTDAAKMQQLDNILKSLKVQFGSALLGAIKPLIPVVTGFFNAFNKLPGPVKSAVFVLGGLVGVLGLLAGPLMTIQSVMEMAGIAITAFGTAQAGTAGSSALLAGAEMSEAGAAEMDAMAHATALGIYEEEETSLTGLILAKGRDALASAAAAVKNAGAAIASSVLGEAYVAEGAAAEEASIGQWLLNAAMDANPLLWVVIAVVALAAGLYLLYTHCKPVRDAINGFGSALQKLGGWIGGGITSGITGLANAFKNFVSNAGNAIMELPGKLWRGFQIALMRIVMFGIELKMRAKQVALTFLNNFLQPIQKLPGQLWMILFQGVMRIVMFANQVRIRALQAGQNILNGVISFVTQLPGRLASFFTNAVGRIASFAGQALSNAGQVGNAAVTGVITYVSQIPQKVYNEFVKIGQKIHDSVASAVSAAANFGNDIKDAVLNALGIHSPGIILTSIGKEFMSIAGRILQHRSSAMSAAESFSKGIVDGFGEPELSIGTKLKNNLNGLNASTSLTATKARVNGSNAALQSYNGAANNNHKTDIHIHEGALQVNANDMNQQQCKQIVINAVEGSSKVKRVIV